MNATTKPKWKDYEDHSTLDLRSGFSLQVRRRRAGSDEWRGELTHNGHVIYHGIVGNSREHLMIRIQRIARSIFEKSAEEIPDVDKQ